MRVSSQEDIVSTSNRLFSQRELTVQSRLMGPQDTQLAHPLWFNCPETIPSQQLEEPPHPETMTPSAQQEETRHPGLMAPSVQPSLSEESQRLGTMQPPPSSSANSSATPDCNLAAVYPSHPGRDSPAPGPTALAQQTTAIGRAQPPLFAILDLAPKGCVSFPWENAYGFFGLMYLTDMATSSVLWQQERREEQKTTKCITLWTAQEDAWIHIRFRSPKELFEIFGPFKLPPAHSTQVLSNFNWQALQKNHFFAQLVATSPLRQREEQERKAQTQGVQIRAVGDRQEFSLALCVGKECAFEIRRCLAPSLA